VAATAARVDETMDAASPGAAVPQPALFTPAFFVM